MASGAIRFPSSPCNDLRLHRVIRSGAALLHELPPRAGGFLGLPEKLSILMPAQLRAQRFQCDSSVGDEPNLDRITEPDPCRIDVDLHRFRLPGFRHELNIRKRLPASRSVSHFSKAS